MSDFLFKDDDSTDWTSLHQGDLLARSPSLASSIREAHAYYAEASDYTHFMVLTQSCDLVRRRDRPKSRYITLAAVRPFQVVVERTIEKYRFSDLDLPISICNIDSEIIVRQLLERFLHNTEHGFFLLWEGSHPKTSQNLCVFLQLSISLRSVHYDQCLKAKVAELDEIFQAKVGWLAGNIYSRIGAPDIEEKLRDPERFKDSFYESVLFNHTLWLSGEQKKLLKKLIEKWRRENIESELNKETISVLAKSIPEDTVIIAERLVDQLTQRKLLDRSDDIREMALNLIANDTKLQRMIRRSQ